MSIDWPDEFITGDLTTENTELLCAIGLIGWANAYVERVPDMFGVGMQKIGAKLGIIATAENLSRYADGLKK